MFRRCSSLRRTIGSSTLHFPIEEKREKSLKREKSKQATVFQFVEIKIAELLAIFVVASEQAAGALGQARRRVAGSAAKAVERVSPIKRFATTRRSLDGARCERPIA